MKATVKRYLKKHHLLYRCFYRSYNKLRSESPLQRLVMNNLRLRDSVFFVQVESNDGLQDDPINGLITRHNNWSGIFVEPVPYLYQRLIIHYKGCRKFTFENKAISTDNTPKAFYYVSKNANTALGSALPPWYDQLGSFSKEHLVTHLGTCVVPYIIEEAVECITFRELLTRHKVTHLDLLHIDTEGSDYDILAQLDFNMYRPSVILFEHKHLSVKNNSNARTLLQSAGYQCTNFGGDTLATL